MIIGIVAIAKNYAIGKDGKLPWHYPADLKFFRQTTTGHAVVMGSNTWDSIGKPLPNRLNIVLSRNRSIDLQPNVLLLRSKEGLLALTEYLKCDVFIIGGAKTYENFSDVMGKWIVTEVPEVVDDADVFMPRDFLNRFDESDNQYLDNGLIVRTFSRQPELR